MVALGLVAMYFSVFLPSAAACPDLTGRYVILGEDGRVRVEIEQRGCTAIRLTWANFSYDDTSSSVHSLTIDGKFQRDTSWFGMSGYQQTSARFEGSVLMIAAKPLATKDTAAINWRLGFRPLPNGDVCSMFQMGRDPEWSENVAAKVRGTTAEDEKAAASRSTEGCPAG